MARVTIENCLKKVDGHFDLVLLAGERAKQISTGKKSEIQKKDVKTHVIALREIEDGVVSISTLRENLHDRANNLTDNEEVKEDSDDLVEELQSSEFIEGELEEISDVDSFLSNSSLQEELDIDFSKNLDNKK